MDSLFKKALLSEQWSHAWNDLSSYLFDWLRIKGSVFRLSKISISEPNYFFQKNTIYGVTFDNF